MKCVLLGGAGFLGSHLTERLLEAGHAVRVFDRPDRALASGFPRYADVEWVEGDFLNVEDVRRAICGRETVFHLVSTTLPKTSNENPVYDVESNVVGTLHLLEAWRQEQGGKVVFVSSGGTVYGPPHSVPISENHPTEPISSYGITKLAIEKYLELYRVLHGVDYCVLRLSNPYGERQRIASVQGAVTTFLFRAHRGEPIEIWGDGSVVRDYVYAGDVADALVRALGYRGERRIINIGGGVGRSLNQILAAVEQIVGKPVERRYLPGRKFDVLTNVLDIRLAREALGWQPATGFTEGLARTLRWFDGQS
jgi:UDP-glucose 4-epimerase